MRRALGKSLKKVVVFSLFGSLILPIGVSAAEKEFLLDEFVVTASRVETKKVDTPANIYVIDQAKLEKRNYANAAEALSEVPGVNILRGGAKGTSMGQDLIMINGDERVLVLIDGRRVNVASSGNYSADWLPAVEMIQKIEILKGAGSAIYGTDAVGGVINIITKKGDIEQGNIRMATGSWNTEQYALNYGGRKDGTGIFVGVNKERRGNFSFKNNLNDQKYTMHNSGYDTKSANIKLDHELGNDNRITFQFEHLDTEGGSPFSDSGYGDSDSYIRLNNNISLRYDWNENKADNGFVQVYKNYQHAYFNSPYSWLKSNFNNEKTGFEVQKNWIFGNNEITGGIEYYKDIVENEAIYGGKRDVNNKSIYLEDRWKFAKNWQLNSGFRYDKHSRYGSEVTPHFALNKKFNDDSNAYISWSRVFNAPTTDDLFWNQPSANTYGDSNLKPEKGNVITLGYNKQIADKTNLSVAIFRSNITDAIDWLLGPAPNYEMRATNLNAEKRRGAEISIEHELSDKWNVNASYTYLRVEQDFDNGSGYLRNGSAQPNTYRAGAEYHDDKWVTNINMKAITGLVDNYIGKWGTSRAYAKNSYFIVDLGVQYKVNKKMKIFAQLNNLTNAYYQEYGALYSNGQIRYPMPSRNFVVGMNYSF